jgi:hypothetical protein
VPATTPDVDRRLLVRASEHHGLISGAEALRLGLTQKQIDRRVAQGRWDRLHPGVFRIAGCPTSDRQALAAAVLWTGGAASPQGIAHRGTVGAASMSAHVTAGEAPSALSTNEHTVSVRVVGDMAVTTVQQRFFNGSEQAAPVEYRLRVPEGAVISGFRVEQGGQWVTAAPGSVAATGGGLPGLLGDTEGGAHANLGVLSPGECLRAEVSYVEWLTRDGAQRAYVYPVGDPVAPQIVGEFVLDVDLTRAKARTARPPEGARLESDGHVRMRRSDWRPRGDLVVDQFGQRGQRLPALTGLGASGCLGGEAEGFEQSADQVRQFPVRAPVSGALQRHHCLTAARRAAVTTPSVCGKPFTAGVTTRWSVTGWRDWDGGEPAGGSNALSSSAKKKRSSSRAAKPVDT